MISIPGFSPAATRPAVPAMVSTQWLCDHLGSDTMVVLDARGVGALGVGALGVGARSVGARASLPEPRCTRIPTAHFVDGVVAFAALVERFGIGPDTTVVVYDGGMAATAAMTAPAPAAPAPATAPGSASSAAGSSASPASALRDLFAAAGHDRVSVLVGGFAKWCAEERPVVSAADSAAA